ncbi:MAG TPA: hypothetical protein VEA78_01200 [Acidimicrobiales bacterium]|nr:hypothetical protein [Acidimicrobiales bacterium]
MAAVTVFVDDVVLGRLPPVCVRTGRPASRRARVDTHVGGSSLRWLLVFAGPIGWVALLLGVGEGETFSARLPVSAGVAEQWSRQRWAMRVGCAALLGAVALGLWLREPSLAFSLLALGAGLVVTAIALAFVTGVDVALDASRRWVVLRGVHDGFAAAVRAAQTPSEPTRD